MTWPSSAVVLRTSGASADDLHLLAHRARPASGDVEARRLRDLHHDAAAHVLLEAGLLDGRLVGAGGEQRDRVGCPVAVVSAEVADAGGGVRDRHRDAGQHGAGFVSDRARDRPADGLSPESTGEQQPHEDDGSDQSHPSRTRNTHLPPYCLSPLWRVALATRAIDISVIAL